MVDAYEAKFAQNKPLWQQYLTYLGRISHCGHGLFAELYPTKVVDIILVSIAVDHWPAHALDGESPSAWARFWRVAGWAAGTAIYSVLLPEAAC